MKVLKILLLSASMILGSVLLTSATHNVDNNYEIGWEDGYCEGWKDVKGQLSLCPLTPLTPLPKLDCYEGYKCGYNRGFKAGRAKAIATK